MKQTANLKWDTKDHEHNRAIKRAAGPLKPKTAYNRNDKSWKTEY